MNRSADEAPWLGSTAERSARTMVRYCSRERIVIGEVALVFEHLEAVAVPRDDEQGDAPLAVLPLASPADAEVAAVLVEDLVTGSWTARLVELPPAP